MRIRDVLVILGDGIFKELLIIEGERKWYYVKKVNKDNYKYESRFIKGKII